MKIIPAIDIKHGKVVRLTQGRADLETIYSDSPLEMAKHWASYGVELIHIVDMDGAFEGYPKNLAIVKEIERQVKSKIELGGGIRDEDTIDLVLRAGVDNVVIGTRALDKEFLTRAAKRFGEKIVVAIDARNGVVFTKGWLEKTKTNAVDFAYQLEDYGIKRINYTDIGRDGMLEGPNIEPIERLLEATTLEVVVGGGVSTLADIERLKALGKEGLAGIIIGKALYEGRIDLKEAMKICGTE
ncbi:MAG: 1-(5-phosphoribosyl)-5-[(5-phosphoribosylamino)methylideneamino]imidazole-4-carboxamide isomerase [Candidatus Omnitrophica bacterium]|nr:1-(5-phosphoribosyl)-5-[(5-phosphoribosylamino)methylideneamino]imidazole-4-carboxamide isomerase [Candidatus Omnitrophota bacterium]